MCTYWLFFQSYRKSSKVLQLSPHPLPHPTTTIIFIWWYIFTNLGYPFFPIYMKLNIVYYFERGLGDGRGQTKRKKRWILFFLKGRWRGGRPLLCPFPPITHPWLLCFNLFFFSFYKLNVIKFEIYYKYTHVITKQ